jgi:hypothetical protein
MNPLRLIIPFFFIVLFIGYVVYMILTKKDVKRIKQVVYPGLFFISVWAVIYTWIFMI